MNARNLPATLSGTTINQWTRLASCIGPHPRYSLPPVRVLVAGDHASLRSSLRTILEMDPRISVVGEASDDCEMVKMSKRLRPDVVLVDLEMRCCDSFEAVSEISKRKLANTIIALTIHDEATERKQAQSAGVNLFLEKGIPSKQLIEAIRRNAAVEPVG
jgi:two-component system, NarL family, nitrate/nitrite response regulator NarL